MFRVTLVNLTEHTKDSWEYGSLLDALKVAKNIDTATPDDLMARPAMTDDFFNKNLMKILMEGCIYVRDDVMVELRKVDEDGREHNIFAYSMAHPPVDKPFIPGQSNRCDHSELADCINCFVEPLEATNRLYPPVGESNIVLGED